jgi:hypothetical protein
MYSNVTENLNRPFCGSMANASGFSVAVNELYERAGGRSLHMYPVCRFVRAGTWEIFFIICIIRSYAAVSTAKWQFLHWPLLPTCLLLFILNIHVWNALEAGIHLMHNREVIVYCENTQIQCAANSSVSYCYSWWYTWLALVTGAVEAFYV